MVGFFYLFYKKNIMSIKLVDFNKNVFIFVGSSVENWSDT